MLISLGIPCLLIALMIFIFVRFQATPQSTFQSSVQSTWQLAPQPTPLQLPPQPVVVQSTPQTTTQSTPQTKPQSTPQPPLQGQNGVSPFLFGVNLDAQITVNAAAAKQLNVQTIRLGASSTYTQNLQMIKNLGLTPLIILRGCGVTDPVQRLSQNIGMIQTAQSIFGANTKLYYEFANENDLQCNYTSAQYTQMWNAEVPQLKNLAPSSWFIGPVNFQYNPPFVASFMHNAVPKPDAISWHEYTCKSTSPASACIANIASWTTHIAKTRAAIQANGDTVPPIMITEWNYSPDSGTITDNKHNDAAFMTQWTTMALQTLAANHIFASYQFDVSNVTPLVGSPQGDAFRTGYLQLIH
jgi:hypothetical protein